MRTRIAVGGLAIFVIAAILWLDLSVWHGYPVCIVGAGLTAGALAELFPMLRRRDAVVCPGCSPRGLSTGWSRQAVTVLGALCVALPMAVLVGIRFLEEGWSLLVLVVAVTKGGDAGAYFVGSTLGRHKLAPRISPRKTIEGAVGGLAASVLVSLALVHMMGIETLIRRGTVATILFGALVGVAGQVGDLAESAVKRRAGVKDSGRSLLALGGVLDLLDSLLLAAPVAYLALSVL